MVLGKCPKCQTRPKESSETSDPREAAGLETPTLPVSSQASNRDPSRTAGLAPELVDRAFDAAAELKTVALLLLILASLGGISLILIGFIGNCPDSDRYCDSDERQINYVLIAVGIVSLLFWYWVFALSRVLAIRLEIALRK